MYTFDRAFSSLYVSEEPGDKVQRIVNRFKSARTITIDGIQNASIKDIDLSEGSLRIVNGSCKIDQSNIKSLIAETSCTKIWLKNSQIKAFDWSINTLFYMQNSQIKTLLISSYDETLPACALRPKLFSKNMRIRLHTIPTGFSKPLNFALRYDLSAFRLKLLMVQSGYKEIAFLE